MGVFLGQVCTQEGFKGSTCARELYVHHLKTYIYLSPTIKSFEICYTKCTNIFNLSFLPCHNYRRSGGVNTSCWLYNLKSIARVLFCSNLPFYWVVLCTQVSHYHHYDVLIVLATNYKLDIHKQVLHNWSYGEHNFGRLGKHNYLLNLQELELLKAYMYTWANL